MNECAAHPFSVTTADILLRGRGGDHGEDEVDVKRNDGW